MDVGTNLFLFSKNRVTIQEKHIYVHSITVSMAKVAAS